MLHTFLLCIVDIKLSSPFRVHLLLDNIDVFALTLFQRMKIFIFSAQHKAKCDSVALARQLIPILSSSTRICLVKD